MEEVSEVMRERVTLEELTPNTTHFLCITVSFNKGLANFSNLKTTDQKLGKKEIELYLNSYRLHFFLIQPVYSDFNKYLLKWQAMFPSLISETSTH